jgi:hypothetical protein
MKTLTKQGIIELGFTIYSEKGQSYFKKGNVCLIPIAGKWAFGSDFGALAFSNTYVDTEEQLLEMMKD